MNFLRLPEISLFLVLTIDEYLYLKLAAFCKTKFCFLFLIVCLLLLGVKVMQIANLINLIAFGPECHSELRRVILFLFQDFLSILDCLMLFSFFVFEFIKLY